MPDLQRPLNLCIYATGSYGRREATGHSDLDLFFIHTGSSDRPLPKSLKALLDADLIRLAERMGFPEFSGYGEYLEIHYLDDIRQSLGSPADDWFNFFTARLLLLLESVPLYNPDLYEDVLAAILDMYYRDYHDHVASFRPLFLANDIIRFWKTLCLNYEHGRDRPHDDRTQTNKNHLKNLKLKFSRLLTCYSTVAALASRSLGVTQPDVLELMHARPLDRLSLAAADLSVTDRANTIDALLGEYSWFLDAMDRPKEELLEWIAGRGARDDAFAHARRFGAAMYNLLVAVARDPDMMRYLVI